MRWPERKVTSINAEDTQPRRVHAETKSASSAGLPPTAASSFATARTLVSVCCRRHSLGSCLNHTWSNAFHRLPLSPAGATADATPSTFGEPVQRRCRPWCSGTSTSDGPKHARGTPLHDRCGDDRDSRDVDVTPDRLGRTQASGRAPEGPAPISTSDVVTIVSQRSDLPPGLRRYRGGFTPRKPGDSFHSPVSRHRTGRSAWSTRAQRRPPAPVCSRRRF